MSRKRVIPIVMLLVLVMSLVAACGTNPAEENVNAPAEVNVAQAEQAAEVVKDAPEAVVAEPVDIDDEAEHLDAAESAGEADHADEAPDSAESADEVDHADEAPDSDEHGQVAVPEFVPPQPADLTTGPEAVAFAMGDPNAPVQIVEFTDYQCPFCQRYALETMPVLVENLVESGRVFYAIKDLPLDAMHPEARAASAAARCAGEQDAYLPMHDAIFAAQADWSGTGEQAEAMMMDLAAELDLDTDAFAACVTEGSQAERVQANLEEAVLLGVNGTPFFFIDGYGVSGAQPYELFEAAVELAENGELGDVIEAQARQAYEAAVQQVQAAQQAPPAPPAAVEVSLDNAYAVGDPNAPVTIVEYTDYQCPFCSRHALETYPQIEKELVETGKVRYVFKDLPLTSIHPQAMLAAEAGRCAGAQDLGIEGTMAMHTALFEKQQAWSGRANAAGLFTGYAEEIGLDGEAFAACLENHDFAAEVQADMEEATAAGITGTPAFVINGHLVSGALPFDVFVQAVESLIAEASVPTGNN